ncbi:response regulator [Echinicola sp. CAU 1574]|uniref:Response regulator n=1 Tax=Echinicola arenosa TaxID=2774144 RepID=A0ABR9AJN6_9BACT|nr:response regulator [Echinicola arenosa]MBD8488971.1 response regulator [Echinicola arenosa]
MKTHLEKTIFIVDDDPFWQSVLSQVLSDMGFKNIQLFNNGKDCLDNLHLNPSLVFLDYQMDETNGLEALPHIKSKNSNTNVVFCTSFEDLNVAISAMESGSHEYLLKSRATKTEVTRILTSLN